ncbi:hypothetical protein FB567DRAFT_527868 [Paraphoma chrysanthemicola]|uniref:Uncharacterized protein n=1 Tax=Paraphoma chrysanthemicola TaxID=798071 RepID=A0A8K0VX91_9PLEO|nr:hypothetical protein FB567DRAFT_527868 [Paraphoma chrysanthemicola]
MHFSSTFAIAILAPLTLAKQCTLTTTRPQACDYDRWHQERKTTIGPGVQVNVQCYSLGRSVQGDGKWLYVRDRECWVPSGVFGSNCAGECVRGVGCDGGRLMKDRWVALLRILKGKAFSARSCMDKRRSSHSC